MIEFYWHKQNDGYHGRVRWMLRTKYSARQVAICYWLPGSKRFTCSASIPVKGGVQIRTYLSGTAAGARKALERDWDKRSIGLFGEDAIKFHYVGEHHV